MNEDRKKELKSSYKSKTVIGGICCIKCSGNQRSWIQTTKNIEGLRNRFNFAVLTQSCLDPSMREEWLKYGIDSFSFTVLEELKKGETQTDKEFSDDINALYELWQEKLNQGDLK